ncbi:hypothetical protein [Streptomyces murinus]|uniref:hypothetical protein n=1 Tax=Streptomyces murinus TaxID=33900 RepID=UPI003823058A
MTSNGSLYQAQVTDRAARTLTSQDFDSPYIAAGHLSAELTAAGYEAKRGWGLRLAEGEVIQYQNLRYEVLGGVISEES